MPYCENCGTQVNPNAKFCSNCGTARQPAPTTSSPAVGVQPKLERISYYSPPPPPPPAVATQSSAPQFAPQTQSASPMPASPVAPMPQVSLEATLGVILFRKSRSLGRYDTYTGVATTQRMIFAQMTSEMLNAAAQQARDQAKTEGKGFFGQWSEQLKSTFGYTKRYLTMPPQAILAETPGNFALNHETVREVKVKLKGANQPNQRREFEVEFRSGSGTYEFKMNENSEFTDLLKRVYGDRVKMPFGYFSKSINIKR